MCRNAGIGMGPAKAVGVTTYIARWLQVSAFDGYIGDMVAEYFSAMWARIIQNSRALLRSPNIFVPRIQTVIDSKENGSMKMARLVLAIDGATDRPLSSDLRKQFELFIDSTGRTGTV
jgi:hypothetical protein